MWDTCLYSVNIPPAGRRGRSRPLAGLGSLRRQPTPRSDTWLYCAPGADRDEATRSQSRITPPSRPWHVPYPTIPTLAGLSSAAVRSRCRLCICVGLRGRGPWVDGAGRPSDLPRRGENGSRRPPAGNEPGGPQDRFARFPVARFWRPRLGTYHTGIMNTPLILPSKGCLERQLTVGLLPRKRLCVGAFSSGFRCPAPLPIPEPWYGVLDIGRVRCLRERLFVSPLPPGVSVILWSCLVV